MAAERPHACILIPTFENAETLEDVVRRSLATGLRVLVVDDGSAAETREILARLADETDAESLVLERHDANRGKGAALATGFRRAGELGFTHVELLPVMFRRELDEHQLMFAMGACLAHLVWLESAGRVTHSERDGICYFRALEAES